MKNVLLFALVFCLNQAKADALAEIHVMGSAELAHDQNGNVCAAPINNPSAQVSPKSLNDPFNKWNKKTFQFNQKATKWILMPVHDAYEHIPQPAQDGLDNLAKNFFSFPKAVADVFRLDFKNAGHRTINLVVNAPTLWLTQVSEKNVFGYANPSGWARTLHTWGVPQGNFVVVPLFGGGSGNIGGGETLMDTASNPLTYTPFSAVTLLVRAQRAVADAKVVPVYAVNVDPADAEALYGSYKSYIEHAETLKMCGLTE